MASLARSCLRMLLLYAIAAVAVGLVVYHRFPLAPAAIWSGIIAGFFVWLTVAYLFAIPSHLLDWWRMRSGAAPRDGKRVAVIGPIYSSGQTLHAPFSKLPCVAYTYKVTSFKGQQPKTDFDGFAMVPSYIGTETGQVKILAYPDLEMPEEQVRGAEAKANAKEFIESTAFLSVRQESLKTVTEELKALVADDDGSMRYDHRMDPVSELDECRLAEKLVRPGETVCVLGRYSQERGAIVPDSSAVVHAATIRKGSPGSFRRGALRKAFGSAIGVVICGGLVVAAATVFAVNVPMDASEQMNPARRFFWEEVKLERWLEKNVRMPLVASGTLPTPAMHLLELCTGCAKGRLEANGRVVELAHASAWENESTLQLHLAAAAGEKDGVTVTFDRAARTSAMVVTLNGRNFPVPAGWLLPTDIQTAGGSDGLLDGRVSVVAPNDSIRLRAAFRTPVEEK